MSAALEGKAATGHASRYLQQLCKHWSHRFEVSFDASAGKISLPPGTVEMTASESHLAARLVAVEAGSFDRLREVFEEHINRFAFKEAPLDFAWSSAEAPS